MTELTSGLRAVFGSASASVHRLRTADDRVRTAMPVSRRISFVAAAGGCGTTSAVAAVGSLLAARRTGMVLAADAGGGRAGLLARTGVQTVADEAELRQAELRRRSARRAEDARTGLPRGATGLHLLDLATPARRPARTAEWAEQVGPISRFYDLVLTDWGVRSAAVEAAEIAALSHIVVVVGRADPAGAVAAAGLVHALAVHGDQTETGPGAPDRARSESQPTPGVVLLLVDVAQTAGSPIGLAEQLGVDVLRVPYDRAHARAAAVSATSLRAATRTAHIELAAALVVAARPRPSAVPSASAALSNISNTPGDPGSADANSGPRRAATAGAVS